MAAAVQSAPKRVIQQKPVSVSSRTDLQKTTSELREATSGLQTLSKPTDPKFLPVEVAEKMTAWAKGRLARIAKTRDPNLVLLCIGKSENENTVVYMGQLKPGTAKLRDDGPAAAGFWIDYAKAADGSKESDFTFFEKGMAYGFEAKLMQTGEAMMVIKALPSKPLRVRIEKLAGERRPRILVRGTCCGVANCRILAVYVTCKKGLIPGVEHIDVIAEHPTTGAPLAERLRA